MPKSQNFYVNLTKFKNHLILTPNNAIIFDTDKVIGICLPDSFYNVIPIM